jgi:hypothetical protein
MVGTPTHTAATYDGRLFVDKPGQEGGRRLRTRGPWGRVRRTGWEPPSETVDVMALRPDHVPPVGSSFADVWAFAERVDIPGLRRPSFRHVDRVRTLWATDGLLPDVKHAMVALQFERRRWRRLGRDPDQAPKLLRGSDAHFIRDLVDEVRRRVALGQAPPARPPRAPAVHRLDSTVMRLDAYRKPGTISVAEVKRQLGRTPLPGDDDDNMVPVVVTGSGPTIRLAAIALHPVPWVAGMTEPIRITALVGGTRVWGDPFYVAELAMVALTAGQDSPPADPLQAVMDVELTWQDGFTYRAPVAMVRTHDGGWGTTGITESVLRYSLYYCGQDDWTKWEPLGFSEWGRILQLVSQSARKASRLMAEGRNELTGGIAWQELVADAPTPD